MRYKYKQVQILFTVDKQLKIIYCNVRARNNNNTRYRITIGIRYFGTIFQQTTFWRPVFGRTLRNMASIIITFTYSDTNCLRIAEIYNRSRVFNLQIVAKKIIFAVKRMKNILYEYVGPAVHSSNSGMKLNFWKIFR